MLKKRSLFTHFVVDFTAVIGVMHEYTNIYNVYAIWKSSLAYRTIISPCVNPIAHSRSPHRRLTELLPHRLPRLQLRRSLRVESPPRERNATASGLGAYMHRQPLIPSRRVVGTVRAQVERRAAGNSEVGAMYPPRRWCRRWRGR
jgi:hypothetical protein